MQQFEDDYARMHIRKYVGMYICVNIVQHIGSIIAIKRVSQSTYLLTQQIHDLSSGEIS